MTIIQALRYIQKKITPAAGDCAQGEAERILTFLLGRSRSALYLERSGELPPEIEIKTREIIKRRLEEEPLAYVLGSAFFYNREFIVTPDVLIPRPDTEVLVEEVLKNETAQTCRFLDIGTGCGCIAAVLKAERPGWKAMASDISLPALKTARKNCPADVALLCADRLAAIKGWFDFIVCNPPYIKTSVLQTLDRSVRDYEPPVALDGGPDGLDFYRYLAETAKPLLKERGRIYCEIGFDQGETVPETFSLSGWKNISIINDLGKRPRVIRALKRDQS